MMAYSSRSIAIASTLFLSGAVSLFPAMAQEPMLTGTVWELQQIQYNNDTLMEANPPENYTIEFLEDNRVAIKADCNVVLGTYTEKEGLFAIALGPSTLAACPPESMDNEFLRALENSVIYFFDEDGNLYMDMFADGGTLKFSPPIAAEMVTEETSDVDASEVILEDVPAFEGGLNSSPPTAPQTTEPIRGLW